MSAASTARTRVTPVENTTIRPARPAKVDLGFKEIARRLRRVEIPPVDVVYGVATGGVVPAALLAYRLGLRFVRIDINYRAPDNTPRRPAPELLAPVDQPAPRSRVLLVDDVSVSGKTLALARTALPGCAVTTLTLKGRAADIVIFPELASCVHWPWKE